MKTTSTCSHDPENRWTEKPYQQASDTRKMTEVVSGVLYTGGLEGKSEIRYLMAYTDEGPVTYVGLERFEGTLDGKQGSFVLRHEGVYAEGEAKTQLFIVPNSGTGALAGIEGSGYYGAGEHASWPVELEWTIKP
ncbi:DUF3224 domain-containing protein [Nostoc sp. NIES-2111]